MRELFGRSLHTVLPWGPVHRFPAISAFSRSLTLIAFTVLCAMSFFFPVGSWGGTSKLLTIRWRIRQLHGRGSMSPWKSSFAIASIFALLILSPTIFSLLASSFRLMSVSHGQWLSSSALHNLKQFRVTSG